MMTYQEIKNRYDAIVVKYDAENTPLNYFSEDCDLLDIDVREQFKVTEPIHLWENYCIGDADEAVLLAETGYDDVDELFSDMDDAYLMRLDNAVDEYDKKMEEQFVNECLSDAFDEFEETDNHSAEFGNDIDSFDCSSLGGYIAVNGVTYAKIRRPERVCIYDAFNQRYYEHPLAEIDDNMLEAEAGYQTGYQEYCLYKSKDRKNWELL